MSKRAGRQPALWVLALLPLILQPSAAASASGLRKVVEEGDVLPDGTMVQTIEAACGEQGSFRPCVAIAARGLIAFYGLTGAGVAAVFTQRGLVVEDGEVLPDGMTLGIDTNTVVGGLASSLRAALAFPGLASADSAIFTPTGLVVKRGQTLPDGTTASINFLGGLAAGARGEVAFHGSNAVFTQNGRIARAGQQLPDGTVAKGISFFGGVAARGWSGRVAFQGFTDNQQAIFSQSGLVAKVGELADGTALDSINLFGGLAMGRHGVVVFHGRTEGHDAVFSQHGLLARAGDTLPDGTVLDAIRAEGGVAINRRGVVVFHGESGGRAAVFSQHGLLARAGDSLSDGTVLDAISAAGGVAISRRGRVAFHGETGGRRALFVVDSRLRAFRGIRRDSVDQKDPDLERGRS